MKNYQDGGEAILEAFRRLDADYVISSPGSEWAPFWEALARQKRDGADGPAYMDCGHESIAVNMATAYTKITGRMQIVLLHAGAGMMQGAMAVDAAGAMETPLVIMSGEVLGYGEGDMDPGSQWYRNLSVPGGTQRLIEPMVKWSQQVASIDTLHETIVRAGEMAHGGRAGFRHRRRVEISSQFFGGSGHARERSRGGEGSPDQPGQQEETDDRAQKGKEIDRHLAAISRMRFGNESLAVCQPGYDDDFHPPPACAKIAAEKARTFPDADIGAELTRFEGLAVAPENRAIGAQRLRLRFRRGIVVDQRKTD